MASSSEWPTGPAVTAKTPDSEACHAAWEAEYQRCRAAGMREREARIEAAKASAECQRALLGMPKEEEFYVPPKERLRFDKAGRLIPPKKAR